MVSKIWNRDKFDIKGQGQKKGKTREHCWVKWKNEINEEIDLWSWVRRLFLRCQFSTNWSVYAMNYINLYIVSGCFSSAVVKVRDCMPKKPKIFITWLFT